ncbi:hypothetical protein BJQ96_03792 [Flavobacterium sp. PL0002]|nr:hypothetical protein [Flavobacterium sp. PL002]
MAMAITPNIKRFDIVKFNSFKKKPVYKQKNPTQ